MTERTAYHHGALAPALLAAVEDVVAAEGAGALSLREVARRAGVSHPAARHHFGDKAGMLTAFATRSFASLDDRLSRAAAAAAGEPSLFAVGRAYVEFAVERPGRFAVMFRPEHLLTDDPAYRAANEAAFGVLVEAVHSLHRDRPVDDPLVRDAALGAWSIVHGFATLWIDGNFGGSVAGRPAVEAAVSAFAAFGATLLAAGSGGADG